MLELFNKKTNREGQTVGFGPRSAVLVTLLIFFGSQIIAGILIGLFFLFTGKDAEAISRILESSVLVQFSFILIVEVLSLLFLWRFIKLRKIKLSEIGITKPSLNNLLYSIPAYGVYFLFLIIALALFSSLVPSINLDQDQQIGFESASGFFALSFVFIALVIFPAVVEEVMIRGFLYGGLIKKYSKVISAVFASLIFAAAHLQLGSGEPPLWVAAIDTFILSIVLIYLREKTGNIWAGVVVHMIKNSFAFISLFILNIV